MGSRVRMVSTGRMNAGCPYVDENQACCASRFSIGRLDQTFSICFGTFHGCPMYHRLSEAETEAARRAETRVVLTVNDHGRRLPVHATGT